MALNRPHFCNHDSRDAYSTVPKIEKNQVSKSGTPVSEQICAAVKKNILPPIEIKSFCSGICSRHIRGAAQVPPGPLMQAPIPQSNYCSESTNSGFWPHFGLATFLK